jgi:hypothetical protein
MDKHPESDPRYIARKNAFIENLRNETVDDLLAMDAVREKTIDHVQDRVFGGSKSQRHEMAEAMDERRMIAEELRRRHDRK